jgi:hypothetical protein
MLSQHDRHHGQVPAVFCIVFRPVAVEQPRSSLYIFQFIDLVYKGNLLPEPGVFFDHST